MMKSNTIQSITPSFPTQSSIDEALKKLSTSDRLRYDDLLKAYNNEISREDTNHSTIAELMAEAQEILSPS